MPYWDWAAQPLNGDTNFPNSVGGSATIGVITPQSNGLTVPIHNPLYSYKFAPLNPIKGDFPTLNGAPVCYLSRTFVVWLTETVLQVARNT